jgi:hypothetical protein
LSFNTSPANAKEIDRQYASKCSRVLKGTTGWTAPRDVGISRIPPIRFYTSESPGGADLTEDFNVYILHFEGIGHTNFYSSGNSCGVAVSTKRNKVIYWTTEWFTS